jgi:predicted P-loop ATPase
MIADIAADLNERIGDLAIVLLGKPNRALSTRSQLRFGSKGSIAVEIAGASKGQWYDHEQGVGGDGLELVRRQKGLANGAAADWASDWLGRASKQTTSASSRSSRRNVGTLANDGSGSPRRTTTVASKGGEAPADQKRAAKVTDIVKNCIDPAGTPAELYLRNRGISVTPLPEAIRFRPNAYGRYGALVALATDAAGVVQGLQLIYVTDDGRKAPVKVQKRTHKAHDGWSDLAAVRLPGNPPLVLTEGVETALSVWQATGREVWACLGISNMARAPVTEGVAVVVARDGDEPGSKADLSLKCTITILNGQGRDVSVAAPPPGLDFNDVLQRDGEDEVRALLAKAMPLSYFSDEWRNDLLYNDDGDPRPVLANAIHALRSAPEWRGVLWHNEFATTTIARQTPSWSSRNSAWSDTAWTDRDDLLVADWLQHQGIMVPASIAGQAVEAVARDRVFHPVREYLDSLSWDGVLRIDDWLSNYLGATDTPYIRAVGTRWLISAIARIFEPGSQADCALILEGQQGIRKSSALRTLGQRWFTDRLSDLGSKDAAMETKGVWIIEIAELDTMSRSEVGTVKAFMTRTVDRFRPPYGKRLVDFPRQCVFAGSVNPEGGYLKDATGGRRSWPVPCGTIDLAALARDRDQLWAEARHRYRQGEPWWLETRELEALAGKEQAARYQGDAWDDLIRGYVERGANRMGNSYRDMTVDVGNEHAPDVSVAEILQHVLGIEKGHWTQVDQNRVARSLTSMGFERYRARRGASREWRYRRLNPNNDSTSETAQGPGLSNLGPGKV